MENIEKDIPLTTMAMALFYLPFMQVILKDYGICIDQGLVLITEDQHAARTFVECYCQHYAGCAVKVGLKDYMKKELDIPIRIAEEPDCCAVKGLKQIIESKELKKMTYSMLDENYRWMR